MPNMDCMNGLGRGNGSGWGRGGRGGGRGGRMNGRGNGMCRRLGASDPAEVTEALQMERDMLKQRLSMVEAMLAEGTADTPPAQAE